MSRRRIAVLGVLTAALLLLLLPAAAPAWKYTFKQFLGHPKAGTVAAGQSKVVRCSSSVSGDYKFQHAIEVSVETSDGRYELELDVVAVMPVTTRFEPMRDINVQTRTNLPKNPAVAKQLEKIAAQLAESQEKFWETVSVRWLQGEQKLLIHHGYLKIGSNVVLEPGQRKTPFKPKPGC